MTVRAQTAGATQTGARAKKEPRASVPQAVLRRAATKAVVKLQPDQVAAKNSE